MILRSASPSSRDPASGGCGGRYSSEWWLGTGRRSVGREAGGEGVREALASAGWAAGLATEISMHHNLKIRWIREK